VTLRNIHHPEEGHFRERVCIRCGMTFVPPEHRPGARVCERCYTKSSRHGMLSVSVPSSLLDLIARVVNGTFYANVSDFAREALRVHAIQMLQVMKMAKEDEGQC